MNVEQFVMAYQVEHDRIRAILPEGYESLRPVFRINAEIRKGEKEIVYVEFNTPVEKDGKRGWLNIANWNSVDTDLSYERNGKSVTFVSPFLEIAYTGVGIEGGCPAEKDNEGCFFIGNETKFVPTEKIDANKEFCDCEFVWKFAKENAYGKSIGKSVAVPPTKVKHIYKKQDFSAEIAANIGCELVAGCYMVKFIR